ncbi:MAG: tRNA (N(6)-L-threonylcarbamoyladenosine(37)-C(2))-methylthiotransferase MtaB [Clostridia bacterium]|nr:tRNA (N(6)-L-threonylcarbamoyladenosine(37)-C(2))-methylthiotransferase MtaB [Clostridia bacterium]
MKIAFYTLGCKVNQYETQSLRELFEKKGHTAVSHRDCFDCIIINSCTVTAESDRKTRQLLNRFRRENPKALIVLTGCMAQMADEVNGINTDIIVGNTDLKRVVDLAEQGLGVTEILKHERHEKFNTPAISDFAERTRAYIKIEDGCERYCSYCIIPYARGFVRSKPLNKIHDEAVMLASKGFKEIVLVGINLSAYGAGENINLCDAVDIVCSVDGIERVRLGSLEPDHISNEMLMRFKAQGKFCPQFHLSLQSGSDSVLKRMNRHYDSAFYEDLVTRIRAIFPNASISTDIMVGFPQESEEEFEESLEFARKISFAKTHVFAYSRRKGTVADKMEGQISNQVKKARSQKMIAVTNKSESEFLQALVGETVLVLFETNENGNWIGYTENYARVEAESSENLAGKLGNVKIILANADTCKGELV